MAILRTAKEVIHRTGATTFTKYSCLTPLTDAPGFCVDRSYPDDTDLARVVTRDGKSVLACRIYFVVDPPSTPTGVSRVRLHTTMTDLSGRLRRRPPFFEDHDYDHADPSAPMIESLQIFRRARKPLGLDFYEEFIYDAGEDRFFDEHGNPVSPEAILDYVYDFHCKTLRARFIWRWRVSSAWRFAIQKTVWKGQDLCLWMLLNWYDIRLEGKQYRDPLHKYRPSEFIRITEQGEKPSFFGFQSSRKSFFTNLAVVGVTVILTYEFAPRWKILGVIYDNDALTTGALVLTFLLADVLGPWILTRTICVLSRWRPAVMFLRQTVRV